MKRQTILGTVFLVAGLTIVGFSLGTHPTPLPELIVGVVVAVLGALIIPSSGAGAAIIVLVNNLGTYVPWVGGRRSGDPPADDKK